MSPPGGLLQLGGYRLVGRRRGLRAVPGTSVGIDRGVGRLGESSVHLVLLVGRNHAVRNGTHQGMPESHPRAELDQSRFLGRGRGIRIKAEYVGGTPENRDVTQRLGGSNQKEPPSVRRERLKPAEKALLDATRQRYRVGVRESLGELSGGPRAWQLEQCEWVAAALGDYSLADARIHRPLVSPSPGGRGHRLRSGPRS